MKSALQAKGARKVSRTLVAAAQKSRAKITVKECELARGFDLDSPRKDLFQGVTERKRSDQQP